MKSTLPKSAAVLVLSPLVLGPVALTYPMVEFLSALGFTVWPAAYVAYAAAGLGTAVAILAVSAGLGYGPSVLGWNAFRPIHLALGTAGAALAALLWKATSLYIEAAGLPSWGTVYVFSHPAWQIPLLLLTNAVIGPFAEETLFRGYLLTAWKNRFGSAAGWIVSLSLFALLHYIPFGSGAVLLILPWSLIPTYLAWRTKSLWPPFIMHCLNNALAYVIIPLLRQAGA